jgi:AraC family transcriptional activator of pobA
MKTTIDLKQIDTLRNLPDMIPVLRDFYEDWTVKVFNREYHECRNYLSPNRRDFYKVLFITEGSGVFTMGLNTYYIDEPTLLYIHPNDIISWKNLSDKPSGYYVLFKKEFINSFPNLKSTIDKFTLYTDKSKSVIRLSESEVPVINNLFIKMQEEEDINGTYKEDSIQAYIQLLMVESMKLGKYPKPDAVTEEFSHIHHFFNLLEKETSNINYNSPIRMRTAKEFAADLAIHPNYLNELLKKHTGQNASTHIRIRLLDEAKVLLLQTDWNLNNISYSMGFSDQPNFSFFFKKNTGITPVEFRKSFLSAKASA